MENSKQTVKAQIEVIEWDTIHNKRFNIDFFDNIDVDACLKKGDFEPINNGIEKIKTFFIPLKDGRHVYLGDGEIEIMEEPTIKKVYFNRMHKYFSIFYFKHHKGLRKPVCEINKPFLYDDKINLANRFKHVKKPYDEFKKTTKKAVEKMLLFIKEVWANNNDYTYDYILTWLANVVRGNKTRKILYLKGLQGIGKSTFTEFMINHVIGNVGIVTGSEPIKSKFNISLMGKVLAVFEELENFSMAEWVAISSKLKRYSTAHKTQYEAKGKDVIEAEDLNNYIVLSNNDAVKDDDGRRYVILDLDAKYKGDIEFWNDLYATCFKDIIGKAFYNYLLEYDITKIDLERMPQTQSKRDAIVKRMDNVAQFIKDEFILQTREVKLKLSEFYDEYVKYCEEHQTKSYNKIDFNKKVHEYGFNHYMGHNKTLKFNIPHDELLKVGEKNNWMHELDEYEPNKEVLNKDLDNGIIDVEKEELKAENEELKKRIAELEEMMNKNKDETITVKPKKKVKKVKKQLTCDIDDDDMMSEPENDPKTMKTFNDLEYKPANEDYEDLDYDNIF